MKAEFLATIGYHRGHEQNAYLVSIKTELRELKSKKIVLLGCGEESYIAEKCLFEKGITVWKYADNNSGLAHKKIRGKEILLPFDLFQEDVHFVITVPKRFIGGARLQMLAHNIDDYSIFTLIEGHSFFEENNSIHQSLMDGINFICFEEERIEDAIPYCGYSHGKDGSKIGALNWLVGSTQWSYPGYYWTHSFLDNHENGSVLEIGPGYGLFSYVLLKDFSRINIHLFLLGNPNKGELVVPTNGYDKGLIKVITKFSDRITYEYRRIEYDGAIDRQFDLIIMTEVFEHFALNPIDSLASIKKMLRDDGRFLLTTPNSIHLPTFRDWKDLPTRNEVSEERYLQLLEIGHVYQYSYEELIEIIDKAGFAVEKYQTSELSHNFLLKKK